MDNQYIEIYLAHSKLSSFKKKVDDTKQWILKSIDIGAKSYVSWSAGKDSTVLTHLVNTLSPLHPIMSQKDDLDFPSELSYVQQVGNKYNLNLKIVSPEKGTIWAALQNTDFTEDVHSRNTVFSSYFFYEPIKKFQKEGCFKAVFLGLRAEESKGRSWNWKKNGHIYYNQEFDQLVFQPMALWSGFDVMAYLVANEIPILDIYSKVTLHPDAQMPHQIRKSWALPSHQASKGQVLWLKYHYPEIFYRLASINPIIRTYL